MNKALGPWALLPCLLLLTHMPSQLDAADVQSSVSTRETYVNLPFTLQIRINNAQNQEPPVIPTVDGLVIVPQGPPSRSYRTTIINGRTTQRNTLTYLYSVTATREGTFTIPPATVVVDGEETQTSAVRIVATQSETDDLLFVEIEGQDDEIYVGEALQLKLKIWVRAYRDQQFNVTLNEATMWSLISKQTQWGNFQESLQEMSKNRKRPGGTLTLREDSKGQEREYLLYEIDATVYPDRPGKIDGDDVRVILNYPEELGRTRSPFSAFGDDFFGGPANDIFSGFGSQIAITSVRPIIAENEVEPITVKPIPEQGRPENYRGAVGQYRIVSEATPTLVKVGDPITLNIGIEGEGPMDLLRAPALVEQQDLTSQFKVPNQPLAGFVNGTQKVFSTTIRPMTEGTRKIPGIEYSYFDPELGQFVSIKSDPIAITVEAADVLALDAIVGTQSGEPTTSTSPISDDQVPEVNKSDFPADVLSNIQRPAPIPTKLIILFLLPPVLAMATALFLSRQYLNFFVSAKYRFKRAILKADTPQEIAFAMEQLLQHRYGLPANKSLRNSTVGALRAAGRVDSAIEVERLYHECENNADSPGTDQLREKAEMIAKALSHPNARRSPLLNTPYLNAKSALFLIALLASPFAISKSNATESDEVLLNTSEVSPQTTEAGAELGITVETSELSEGQIKEILDEASSLYVKGMQGGNQGNSSAMLAEAAAQLQVLADSGIVNDQLFATLASAQATSGNPAGAIANYRRALRYAPSSQQHHNQLLSAEAAIGSFPKRAATRLQRIRAYNDALLRFIPPKGMLAIALLAWFIAWGCIAWRLLSGPQHWKLPTACLVLLASTAFSSYQLRVSEFSVDHVAVITQPEISLREGDGIEFAVTSDSPFQGGDVVEVLDRRGVWHKIKLSNGQSGWVPTKALQLI